MKKVNKNGNCVLNDNIEGKDQYVYTMWIFYDINDYNKCQYCKTPIIWYCLLIYNFLTFQGVNLSIKFGFLEYLNLLCIISVILRSNYCNSLDNLSTVKKTMFCFYFRWYNFDTNTSFSIVECWRVKNVVIYKQQL